VYRSRPSSPLRPASFGSPNSTARSSLTRKKFHRSEKSPGQVLPSAVGHIAVGGFPCRFGPDHKARLRALIEKTLLSSSVDEEALADVMRREEAIQAQAAGVPVEAPVAPPPPVTPPPPDNVVSIDGTARANANRPPASYLREGQPREPWRDFVEGGRGTVEVACWSPPDERRR
jgi:hypothetical protein